MGGATVDGISEVTHAPAWRANRHKLYHQAYDVGLVDIAGERSRILKFSTHHQDQSMEPCSNEGERSASTYPCRSCAEAYKRTELMESYSS